MPPALPVAVPEAELPHLLQQVLEDAIELLSADKGTLQLYDPDAHALVIVAQVGFDREFLDEFRRVTAGDRSICGTALALGRRVIVQDLATDPRFAPEAGRFARFGVIAAQSTPLYGIEGTVYGMLSTHFSRPRVLSAWEQRTLDLYAGQAARAIERTRTVSALQQTMKLNELFTGILGHDLRNPLGTVLMSVEVAIAENRAPVLERPLARILTNTRRMARIIDHLIDLTRVRLGTGLLITRRRADLAAVVRDAAEDTARGRAADAVVVEICGDTTAEWDAERMAQVFANLIDNGLRHGAPDQPVTVRVDGNGADRVVVTIHDRGCIPPDRLARLFEPGDREPHRGGGLGLGLYITRAIVVAHGGGIDVRSDASLGTTFTVTLPRSV